jgi:hypothetical protein
LIEASGWPELLRSFGTQASAGIKYGDAGIMIYGNHINIVGAKRDD